MPPKKRKNGDSMNKNKKKKKNKKEEEEEDDFNDGFESPISDHLDSNNEGIESDKDSNEENREKVLEIDSVSGEILICGGTNWDMIGRKQPPKTANGNGGGKNLYTPHRINSLIGQKIRLISSGCMACHSVVVKSNGETLSWGRNENGQLGLGDLKRRDQPTLIKSLETHSIVKVACGKSHTLFLTDSGVVYATGSNTAGQLGIGKLCPSVPKPTKIPHKGPPISGLSCGSEFSAMFDIKGNLYCFGSPEFGQLGLNSDGKYFVSSSKIGFDYKKTPHRVLVFVDKSRDGVVTQVQDVEIMGVACGQNHVVALDKKGRVYSWGFGGYGRLGHQEAKDELVPRLVKFFDGPNRGASHINCGSTFSMAVSKTGVLYLWGQNKATGEAAMYPKPVHDLSGWKVRQIGCCHKSIVLAADESMVSWGCSPTYGELGLGDSAPKSSSTPMESKPMDGLYVERVACGWGHTLLLVRSEKEEEIKKINILPVYQI